MDRRDHTLLHLHTNLTDESKAYGYTLVIWGSGALLIEQYNFPVLAEVMSFITGAIIGFGLLAVIAWHGVFRDVPVMHDERLTVASMIHFLAALGTISISKLLHVGDPVTAFFIVGVNASIMYNLLLLLEAVFTEELRGLEEQIHPESAEKIEKVTAA